MKLSIRTLDQRVYNLELEATQSVLELKRRLVEMPEIKQPLENLQLIYGGSIMQDEQPLSNYKVEESKCIILMNKRIVKEEPADETPKQKTVETPLATPAITSVGTPSLTPNEQLVSNLVEMGYEEAGVRDALRASYNNPERAIEYLISGIPVASSRPERTVHDLVTDPHYEQAVQALRQNPALLGPMLSSLREADPAAFETIRNNQDEFVELLMPMQQADDGGIQLSSEDEDAIQRLIALGFRRQNVVSIYIACDRNEQLAAQMLFGLSDDEDGED